MRSHTLIVLVAVIAALSACGDDSAEGDAATASTSEASAETTTTAAVTAEEAVETEPAAASEPGDALPPGAGRAELGLGDMSVEFTGLTCFEGSVAAELGEDEDLVFAAVAQNGDAEFLVTISDKGGLNLLEVVYVPGDGSGTWHLSTTDVEGGYTFEDGLLSVADDFELVVDRAEADRVVGQLEASCG